MSPCRGGAPPKGRSRASLPARRAPNTRRERVDSSAHVPSKRRPPNLVFEELLESAHIELAVVPERCHRIEVLDLLLRDVGDAEAPVVGRDVARDDHEPELENVSVCGLDFGCPGFHVGVTVRRIALEHLKSVGFCRRCARPRQPQLERLYLTGQVIC